MGEFYKITSPTEGEKMGLNLKNFAQYVEQIPRFIFIMLHELSHWIFAFIGFYLSLNGFPRISVTRWFSIIQYDKDDPTQSCSYGICAQVTYTTWYNTIKAQNIHGAIIASSPIFLTISLFLFSPWWMYPLYIANLSTMWISWGDYEDIKKIFNKPTT